MRRFVLILVLIVASEAFAAPEATVYSREGDLSRRKAGAGEYVDAPIGVELFAHDSVRTGRFSRAGLVFNNGVFMRLNALTTFEVAADTDTNDKKFPVKIEEGAAHFLSREPSASPEVETPLVSASVLGTEFVVDVTKERVLVTVMNGEVRCYNK